MSNPDVKAMEQIMAKMNNAVFPGFSGFPIGIL